MPATYLSLVNSAITESGADLATFKTDGSDFTTNTNSLMNKFKTWVSRAWKDIQQEAYDWDFMSEQAVVNIDPGFMFYTQSPATIKSVMQVMPNDTLFNILDQSGTVAVPNLKVNYIQDLTGLYTSSGSAAVVDYPFAAMTLLLADPNTNPPLNIAFKSGSEYFNANTVSAVILSPTWSGGLTVSFPTYKGDTTSFSANFLVTYPNNTQANVSYNILLNSPDWVINPTTGAITMALNSTLSNILLAGNTVALVSASEAINFSYKYLYQNPPPPILLSRSFVLTGTTGGDKRTATGFSIDGATTQDGKSALGSFNTMCFTGVTLGTLQITSLDGLRYLNFTVSGGAPQSGPNANGALEYDFAIGNGTGSSANPFPTQGETVNITCSVGFYMLGGPGTINYTTTATKCYVHSWKSFDFEHGETQDGDFLENVQEIDEKSFRLTDYFSGSPLSEVPLTFVPWEVFRTQYDLTGAYPGLPRVVTKDNTGRWRFYPSPYYRVTVSFDYVRKPQILTYYTDTVFEINDDFTDIIMWKALVYFGEYDEQPSVAARATKNYKQMLARLELKNRAKFHFLPHRMW